MTTSLFPAISPIEDTITSAGAAKAEPLAADDTFGDFLRASVGSVEKLGAAARTSAERFLNGEGEELHQVALAAQKAELSFDLFLQSRNKVIQAYQEVMRMQL
jgi:flagellar hook-basal body complex protein FliE